MKILLIQSFLGDYNLTVVFPLGLAYLAAVLHDHDVKIIDGNVEKDFHGKLKATVADFQPDIVGISFRNSDDQNREQFKNFYRNQFQPEVKLIRKLVRDIPFFVGGAAFSIFPEEVMRENKEIDYGIYLEGEESFPELLNNLDSPWKVKGVFYRDPEQVVQFTGKRPLLDFKNLPQPRRDLLDLTLYTPVEGVGVQTNRGCINECSYCVYPFLSGSHLRLRDPISVVDEIQDLLDTHNIDSFFFADSSFGMAKKYAEKIFLEIISRKLPVTWGAYLDLTVDEEFLLLAHKAGCRWFIFSPDGYSTAALKGLKKHLTHQQVADHIQMLFNHPLLGQEKVLYSFMLSPPGETFLGLLKTVLMIYKFKIIIKLKRKRHFNIIYGWIRIEPQTHVLTLAEQQGHLPPEKSLLPENNESISHIFYRHPTLHHYDKILLCIKKTIPIFTGFFRKK